MGPRNGQGMFVFAHVHKCAGTSVVRAAMKAGLKLPDPHLNGHPANPDGHAMSGLSALAPDRLAAMLERFASQGVQFLAIEWDYPSFSAFPSHLELKHFTLLRDPVRRLVSSYQYDLIHGYTNKMSILAYIESDWLWTRCNYITRFFACLQPDDPVTDVHVDSVYDLLTRHYRYAFVGDPLSQFLQEKVGLPIKKLGHHNKTSSRAWLFLQKHRLRVTDREAIELYRLNQLDYRLCDLLLKHQR